MTTSLTTKIRTTITTTIIKTTIYNNNNKQKKQEQINKNTNDNRTLKQYEKTYVDVMGHTDSTGSDAYNQTLSERRASAVADYLSIRGVQSARLATRGYGESQPKASNLDPAGRSANRRVEIRLVPVTQG
jgi:outer membrane protein OmpA-like peptidoglycan-associated protein